jgi:dTDP-glucose 4,6-dehydratase
VKRILITGAAGLFGHHLLEHVLKNTDWEVVALVRLGRIGSLRRTNEVLDEHPEWDDRVRFVWHDLRSPVNPYTADEIGEVDYIVHAAASTHVDESIKRPEDFVLDNVVATANLLQFARQIGGLRFFHYFSTDEVTGPAPDGVYFDEHAELNPTNPYSASKAGAEALVTAFGNTYRLPVYITRTMNLIGQRASTEKFLPLVIKKVLAGEELTIHADPTATRAGTRHYLHCRNAAAATLFLLERARQRNIYNVVGKEIDNLTFAKTVAQFVGKPLRYKLVDFHSSRPGHDLAYRLDDRKLRAMGFEYPISLEESLERTVAWTLAHPWWLK